MLPQGWTAGLPLGEPVLLPAPPSADWHLYSQSLEMDGAVYFLCFPFFVRERLIHLLFFAAPLLQVLGCRAADSTSAALYWSGLLPNGYWILITFLFVSQ